MAIFHKEHLRSPRFGAVTWIYIGAALGLGFVVPRINQWLFPWLVSPLDKAALSTILSSIASGMITLTGIVFSLVFVIVQFGSSTYSPRITRIFAHTRVLRHALGIFTGTFLYSLMALRTIGIERTDTVSFFTVWFAFLWLLASVAVLAQLVRVFTTLTIGNVLFTLSRAGQDSIAELYALLSPKKETGRSENTIHVVEESGTQAMQGVIYEGVPGYVIRYNVASLAALARATDTVIHLPYAIGDAVKDGEPIALISGTNPSIPEERIYDSIVLGRERAFQNDPKYALRLLVDMAIRALSPAINDPTTAVQALDHIEMLLCRLGNAELDIGEVRDANGKIRVVYSTPRWEDFLQLGLSEIIQYGATSLQVQRRLEALLRFLRRSVPPSRIPAVDQLAEQRRAMVPGAFDDETFREWANVPDRGGIGGGKEN